MGKTKTEAERFSRYQELIGLLLQKDSFNKSKIYESLPGEKTAFIGRVIGELVPTEAELARREGRSYEPASALLARIKKEWENEVRSKPNQRNQIKKGMWATKWNELCLIPSYWLRQDKRWKPMSSGDDLLKKVIERILAVTKPERIILFGSTATGSMTRDSDLDLLVLERGLGNQRQESARLREALGDLGVPVDVFAMDPERFEETKEVIGGLAYPANKYGRVIYEAA